MFNLEKIYSFKRIDELVTNNKKIDHDNNYSLNRSGYIDPTENLYFINKENETRHGRFYAKNDLEAMFWFRSAIEKGLIETQLVFEN